MTGENVAPPRPMTHDLLKNLLVELGVVTLEAIRVRNRLCIATRCVLRAFSDRIYFRLCLRGGSVYCNLRRERLIQLCTGGRGHEGRHDGDHQRGQPIAGSFGYLGIKKDHDNKRLLNR